ncbi:hypothetical protein [Oceanicola sp. S124]|uniref:hypothetical protein n=1 Tax=Oceanicola sp. S124 TaxID=1042378 RepID=UPI000255A9D3|nr:hypothetical protein [Oceanicola sp. S124]
MPKSMLAAAALMLLATLRPGQAHATDVYFENECSDTVRVAVNYIDTSGNEQTEGYYVFEPGEEYYLFTTNEGEFEFYAFDKGRVWRCDHRMPSVSSDYNFESHQVTFSRGDSTYSHSVSCETTYGDDDRYQIRMATECNYDIFVALRYQDLDGRWQMASWYRLKRGEVAYLPRTRLDYFYYYGESETFTEDGEETWYTYDRPHDFSVDGKVEGFIQKDINPNSHALVLTCTG